ncbi:MAG: BCCT family transporter [Burkholderiales bacterium]|jgi:choline/carnitine/betaine transport|nr:BCCT family transporter [Burkholderiales bacterium]
MQKQNNAQKTGVVMLLSASMVLALAAAGALWPDDFGAVAKRLLLSTTTNFGWFYLLTVFVIVIFLLGLALSRHGSIRLGPDGSRPEFPLFTWIAMLFSAGFGAGLVFWGVAEPMSHFFTPPFPGMDPQSAPAARVAMGYSFFHWGISQWSVFALTGLGIGFMQFRKGRDGLVSTALEPVVGKRQGIRTAVDVLAVVATVMGIATSLGLGVLQISGGLQLVTGWTGSLKMQLLVIAVMFAAYMLSSTSGLHRGIRWLSNVNLGLCLALLLFVFIAGPTVFVLNAFTLGLGDYLSHFVEYSLRLTPYRGGTWVRDWTIFYWAWAIAWSPFVGAFVARVSRGRTIREFIVGVLVVPPAIACVWIATFGGMALHEDLNHAAGIAAVVDRDVAVALFTLYRHLPLGELLSMLSILLIFIFLVTSADSATYILAGMASGGNPDPRQSLKLFWGMMMSVVAAVLLAAGGLSSLQTASLVAALPFTLLLILMMAALIRLLRAEALPEGRSGRQPPAA